MSRTLSRELPLSWFFSDRLLPESVLMREPRESAWRTELMLGVDEVWGDAVKQTNKGFRIMKAKICCFFYFHCDPQLFHSQVPEMAPNTSLCKLVSRKVLDLGGVIKALVSSESSRPFWGKTAQHSTLTETVCEEQVLSGVSDGWLWSRTLQY